MKQIKFIMSLSALTMLCASCADEFESKYEVATPESIANYGYLKDFDNLKSYVNHDALANFKVGGLVAAADFNKGGVTTVMYSSNFDEISSDDMQLSKVASNDGTMKLATVADFITTASKLGVSVFGSNIISNEKQNVKYLNSLLADKEIERDPNAPIEMIDYTEKRNCFKVVAGDGAKQDWDTQFWICSTKDFAIGDSWSLSMTVRADKAASAGTQCHTTPGAFMNNWGLGNVDFTTEWQTLEFSGVFSEPANWWEGNPAGGQSIAFNLNVLKEANNYYFDDIIFKINDVEVGVNGNAESPTPTNHYAKNFGEGDPHPATIVNSLTYQIPKPEEIEVEIKEPDRNCFVVTSGDNPGQDWDTQFWICSTKDFAIGDSWSLSMTVRADKAASAGTQCHTTPGAFMNNWGLGNVDFTTEWQTLEFSGVFSEPANWWEGNPAGGQSIAFNLNVLKEANKYYFDDISFKINGKEVSVNGNAEGEGATNHYVKNFGEANPHPATISHGITYTVIRSGNSIPLTDEEKVEALKSAIDKWTSTMMDITEGKVTSWNVVNKIFNEDGSDLQRASTGNAESNFYWQDYMSDTELVSYATSSARKNFKGEASALKLFVNEAMGSATKVNNVKARIATWEAANATIDGIGAELNLSYSADANVQSNNENNIVNIFEALAQTGKIIRISALNISYANANGDIIKELNEDQKRQISEFYKFVVKTYIEKVPADKNYGISLNNVLDNGELGTIGLWDAKSNRNHSYAGFIEGLSK